MSDELIGVFGYRGFGKQVMELVKMQLAGKGGDFCYVDDNPGDGVFNGLSIMTFTEFNDHPAKKKKVVVAVADSSLRRSITKRCEHAQFDFLDVEAANAIVMDNIQTGMGLVVCPFSMISTNLKVGKSFHLNIYSYIAHDCIIGDFVTFAPGVKCNGNVHIEDDVYIGTGAIIKQGTPSKPLIIGKGAVVGMGAVVTKDVAPGVTVVGNPARPLVKA